MYNREEAVYHRVYIERYTSQDIPIRYTTLGTPYLHVINIACTPVYAGCTTMRLWALSLETSMGERDYAQSCLPFSDGRADTLCRVTPLLRMRTNKDRIDSGQHRSKSTLEPRVRH